MPSSTRRRCRAGGSRPSIDFVPGERPAWGIGMLTDDEKFVGIRQADDDLSSLLSTYVDADAVQGDTVTVPGALTAQWQEWSDAGGDHAYSAWWATTKCWSMAPRRPTTC